MYPDSPFASSIGSFRRPQPLLQTDPDKGKQIQVCFSDEYLPYILGSLEQLLLQATWATDNTIALELAQQRVNTLIWLFQMAQPCAKVQQVSGGADGDDNMIRQNPDNPCELQTSIDGANWCTFADLSLCIPAPAQPARDTAQPEPGGGVECYRGELQANSNWLLPAPVNTGDTLELTDAFGAGSDGGATWRCPDGKIYFAGTCQPGTEATDGGDPDATVYHMALLWVINGSVYLNAMSGPVTIPSGIVNGTVVLQVNDGSLAGNFGSYQFTACFTNNGDTSFSHTFDFQLGTHDWYGTTDGGDNAQTTWESGVGWKSGFADAPYGTQYTLDARREFDARVISSMRVFYTIHLTPTDVYTHNISLMLSGSSAANLAVATTDGNHDETLLPNTSGDRLQVVFSLKIAGGTVTLTKVIVTGVGSDPF